MLPSMLMSQLSWTLNRIVATCYCRYLDKISALYQIVLTVICFRDATSSACSEMVGWLVVHVVSSDLSSLQSWKEKSREYCLWLGKFPSYLVAGGWESVLGQLSLQACPVLYSSLNTYWFCCMRWENGIDEPVLCLLCASCILIDTIFEYLSST